MNNSLVTLVFQSFSDISCTQRIHFAPQHQEIEGNKQANFLTEKKTETKLGDRFSIFLWTGLQDHKNECKRATRVLKTFLYFAVKYCT